MQKNTFYIINPTPFNKFQVQNHEKYKINFERIVSKNLQNQIELNR